MFGPISVVVEGGFDVPLPRMVPIRQTFVAPREVPVREAVAREMNKPGVGDAIRPGARVAIAVGSRGIAQLQEIVRAVVEEIRRRGGTPFIVPAMGSHGGATAEGQRDVLAGYGITESQVGAPVQASMEVVELGRLPCGTPVYFDRVAYRADAVVIICRVKPHTDFKGPYESGLCKMLTIGLGKHKGATALHAQGFDRFAELIPAAAQVVLERAPIAFGVAVIENAYDDIARLVAVPRDRILDEEPELLREAKALMPKLPVSPIDVLIVDEIGKDISGAGMDPNITGRTGSGLPGFEAPPIQKIVVRDLTPKTKGNACGIGLADVTTLRVLRKIDFGVLYANSITSTVLEPAKIPVVMNNDKEAIVVALKCCNRIDIPRARVVRIKNTLELEKVYVSEACLEDVRQNPAVEVVGAPRPMAFDETGTLLDDFCF